MVRSLPFNFRGNEKSYTAPTHFFMNCTTQVKIKSHFHISIFRNVKIKTYHKDTECCPGTMWLVVKIMCSSRMVQEVTLRYKTMTGQLTLCESLDWRVFIRVSLMKTCVNALVYPCINKGFLNTVRVLRMHFWTACLYHRLASH